MGIKRRMFTFNIYVNMDDLESENDQAIESSVEETKSIDEDNTTEELSIEDKLCLICSRRGNGDGTTINFRIIPCFTQRNICEISAVFFDESIEICREEKLKKEIMNIIDDEFDFVIDSYYFINNTMECSVYGLSN